MKNILRILLAVALAANLFPTTTEAQAPPRNPDGRARVEPYTAVSEASLFADLEALTSIRPYAGWRNSASAGEAEAITYVLDQLASLPHLVEWGLEIERQPFTTFSSTEFRTTDVSLTVDGDETPVPAFGISGHRDWLSRIMYFDSDGVVNDSDPDPVTVEGPATVVINTQDLAQLGSLEGRVAVVNYALLDRATLGWSTAWGHAATILDAHPAAIVPVTRYSNVNGVSHGSFAGDLPVWSVFDEELPPILTVRLEDLGEAGISTLNDLRNIDEVRLTWDMDVYSPGYSENAIARIPGRDSSQAIILGAHIDSPNNPGGIDDGSGSVTILQVARSIDATGYQPPVDLYLVWFGSHERGVYGSSTFIAEHQDLIDRTIAMLQVDCLSVPLDGISMRLNVEAWPYGHFGDNRLPWPEALASAGADQGVTAYPLAYYGLVSDNSNFTAWDVPNANLIFMAPFDSTEVHYAGHMHDPYDSPELARTESTTLQNMATVAIAAAIEPHADDPLRVTPIPDRRAVVVSSHTESTHMTASHFVELGMALAWDGFDLDMVPYGREVTTADLDGASMVIVLPVHDYPSLEGDVELYDEAYSANEIDALVSYANDGGFLVITNSARRLKYFNYAYEANEDWTDMNELAAHFGMQFGPAITPGTSTTSVSSHTLLAGVTRLDMAADNGLAITYSHGQQIASVGSAAVAVFTTADTGEVLALGDLGMLSAGPGEATNLRFWQNLAEYARSR